MALRNGFDKQSVKRKDAEERKYAWECLSIKEKIASLDGRLGKGKGAKKQRARLLNQLNGNNVPVQKLEVAPMPPTPLPQEEDTQQHSITVTNGENGFVARIKGISEVAIGATKAEARANAKKLIKSYAV
jgi:hypothetical protein